MPGLALIAEEFIDRVGFMTILISWDSDKDVALSITDSVNAPFITVNVEHYEFGPMLDLFISGYIPEFIIIDENGNVVDRIVGGSSDDYRLALNNALNG